MLELSRSNEYKQSALGPNSKERKESWLTREFKPLGDWMFDRKGDPRKLV